MTSQTQSQQTINHFSHPHTLHLSYIPNNPLLQSFSCSGCKLNATGGLIYTCTLCNYFLHINCSQMPQKITHPFHKDHVFSLLSIPQYQSGYFNCDACGKIGHGFAYHCKSCSLDLHIFCASMPLSINHQSHFHTLDLAFSPPYFSKIFNCDICNTLGSNHWLYRCTICEFDAHLDCARKEELNMEHISTQFQQPATGIPLQQFVTNQGVQGPLGINGAAQINTEYMVVQQRVQQQLTRSYQESYNPHYIQAPMGGGGLGRGRLGGRINGGILGGNGGGFGGVVGGVGNGGVQFVKQALTGILGGNGGGFGGVVENDAGILNLLQSLGGGGGGGGGGLDTLQALLGGGGGGGLDAFGGGGGLQFPDLA